MATLREELWDVATDQYGFVTTTDVRNLGCNPVELAKLAHRNKLEHIAHGVYRFTTFPTTERDDYMRAVLATGVPEAVLSHDTALLVHDLCDINPTEIHVTVPRSARVRRELPLVEVHNDNLDATDRGWWEGIPTVTPETAIRQGIEAKVPRHLLVQALKTAEARGAITKNALNRLRSQLGHG